jgi:hypothetical protein
MIYENNDLYMGYIKSDVSEYIIENMSDEQAQKFFSFVSSIKIDVSTNAVPFTTTPVAPAKRSGKKKKSRSPMVSPPVTPEPSPAYMVPPQHSYYPQMHLAQQSQQPQPPQQPQHLPPTKTQYPALYQNNVPIFPHTPSYPLSSPPPASSAPAERQALIEFA